MSVINIINFNDLGSWFDTSQVIETGKINPNLPKVLSTPLTTIPTATGNTTNKNQIVTGSDGLKYFIDFNGNAALLGSDITITSNNDGTVSFSKNSITNKSIKPIDQLNPITGSIDILNDKVLVYDASTSTHVSVTPDKIGITTPATTTQLGLAQLATTLETENGTDLSKVLTPASGEAVYIKKSALNAKGDIISASADNTPSILTVGTNGQVLIADSTTTTGLKWSNITGNVRYGTIVPIVLGSDLKGDIYLMTTSGDNTTPVIDSYVYDGFIWVKLSTTTTHTLTSAINTLTSTVNGIVTTANIVNSISNTSSANTILTTVNGVAGSTVPIINTNTLTGNTANGIVSTINGVAATLTPVIGTITNNLGFDSTGAIVSQASVTISPNSQTEVTNGTVITNKYVQPDTLKVELDKKQNKLITTTLVPKVFTSGSFVDAQANLEANVADCIQLTDTTKISQGLVTAIGHGYTVGDYYYLSQTTAGIFTNVIPTSGLVQRCFFVVDANTILVDLQSVESVATPPTFANTVYVNATTPTTATIFDLANPPITNNTSLVADSSNIYVGNNGSTWTYNSGTSTYVTYVAPASTEWNLGGTTTDAGSNKTSAISRTGNVGIGVSNPLTLLHVNNSTSNATATISSGIAATAALNFTNSTENFQVGNKAGGTTGFNIFSTTNAKNIASFLGTGSVGIGTTNPLKLLHVQDGGTSLLTSSFGGGELLSTNLTAGARLLLEHLTSAVDQKTISLYNQGGVTQFGSLNDVGNTFIKPSIISMNHTSGNVGINTSSSVSTLDINGSYGVNTVTTSAAAYTVLANDSTIVLSLVGAQTVTLTTAASSTRRIITLVNPTTTVKTVTAYTDLTNTAGITTIPANTTIQLQSDGTIWRLIENSSNYISMQYVAPVAPATTDVTPAGITSATASDYLTLTVPSAGVWEIDWTVRGTVVLANGGITSVLTDNANTIIGGETLSVYSQTATNVQASGTGKMIVTTTGATTYKVRVFSLNAASSGQATSSTVNGRSWMSAKRIQ